MNKRGNSETLVAAHPRNTNAVKSGVFSRTALAPRVHELEAAIASRPPEEVAADVLRREVAALAALSEAMDESLAKDGLNGRKGEPRSLITLRLRVNERLRRSLDHYAETVRSQNALSDILESPDPEEEVPGPLVGRIAYWHGQTSIEEVAPAEFDPETFLRAMITTTDSRVTTPIRLRARKLLTRRRSERSATCTCFATLRAHDEHVFRYWVDEVRELPNFEPSPHDPEIALIVRALARDDRDPEKYPIVTHKTREAFAATVREGVARLSPSAVVTRPEPSTGEDDDGIRPFWQKVLSPRHDLPPKERLQAFEALDELTVLPRCRCESHDGSKLEEIQLDEWYAYTIRLMPEKHYRAAMHIARYPQTFFAVRDVIDNAYLEQSAQTAEAPLSPEIPGAAA